MTFQGPEKPNAEFQDFMQVIGKFENFPQSKVHFARVCENYGFITDGCFELYVFAGEC